MKKALIYLTIITMFFLIIASIATSVNATQDNKIINEVVDNKPNGTLLQLKEQQAKTLEEYQAKYNSESYGFTAYILHLVQIYSIPFCFLGIVISIIYKVVIGARNLENVEKGLGMMVAIITVTVICQVLPLVFALVVKVGRE